MALARNLLGDSGKAGYHPKNRLTSNVSDSMNMQDKMVINILFEVLDKHLTSTLQCMSDHWNSTDSPGDICVLCLVVKQAGQRD